MTTFLTTLFLLCIAHAFGDTALQSINMSKRKRRDRNLPYTWIFWLVSHTLIHAGCVYIVTQNIYLAFAEFICHTIIDFIRCEKKITFYQDQLLHFVCKVIWTIILIL